MNQIKTSKKLYIADLRKQPLEVFYNKKVVPKNSVIFTGKRLCWSLFLVKWIFIKNETPTERFSFDYCDYFLIPSSNENNLIYLQSSEWGKHDNKQQISSSAAVLSFVF